MKVKSLNSKLIIAFLFVLFFSSCAELKLEHEEARNIVISNIDFSKLKNGKYIGNYDGGMLGWRKNKCQIDVSSQRVIDIKLIESVEDMSQDFFDELYGKVIANQSLQVDVVSGATLTSKAHLKAVEDALFKAEQDTLKLP